MPTGYQPLVLELTPEQHAAYAQSPFARRSGGLSLAQALIQGDIQPIGGPCREDDPKEARVIGCSTRELTALTFRAKKADLDLDRYLRFSLFTPDQPPLTEEELEELAAPPTFEIKARFTAGEWAALSAVYPLPDADRFIGDSIDQVIDPMDPGQDRTVVPGVLHCSEREFEVITYLAGEAGMGMTAYLRRAAFGPDHIIKESRASMVSMKVTETEFSAYAASDYMGYGSTRALVKDLISLELEPLDVEPDDGKERRFTLAVTPDELNMINLLAATYGMPAGPFVRRLLFGV